MQVFYKILFTVLVLSACGGQKEAEVSNVALEEKLNEMATLKAEQATIGQKISSLEAELLVLDPSRAIKPKLVSTETIATEGFSHYINLQGMVNSDNITYIAPRNGMGGYVKQLYIKAGQSVKKGQLILKLDDQVLRQSIEATKTQATFAKNIYDRTKALWDQNIGTEVQLISAKNNVEALESQIKIQEEQLKTYLVYADQNGVADIVNIKVGELFTGVGMTGPQIQIVNNGALNVKVDIPENYAGKVKVGNKVLLEIPALGKSINSVVTRISQSINEASRGFTAECSLPNDSGAKPNMASIIKILNHSNAKAIVVPVNIVQSDEKGKYVYIMGKNDKNVHVAQKKSVSVGQLYGENIEILSGLAPGDQIIIQGYQNLYEGQKIESNQK